MSTRQQTIFITGGGSGIGRALAQRLCQQGHRVIICGRTEEKLVAACRSLDGCEYMLCDLTSSEDIDRVTQYFADNSIQLDVLINNAGGGDGYPLIEGGRCNERLSTDVSTNLLGPMHLTQSLLPFLLHENGGKIVNINSGFGLWPSASVPGYSISKHGMRVYSEILRVHLAEQPIAILDVFPPLVDTALVAEVNSRKISPEYVADRVVRAMAKNKKMLYIGEVRWIMLLTTFLPVFSNIILKYYPISYREMRKAR